MSKKNLIPGFFKLAFASILLLLFGCGPKSEYTNSPLNFDTVVPPINPQVEEIFEKCGSAICWHGIVPDKTNKVEAENTLKELYGDNSLTAYSDEETEWVSNESDHLRGGVVRFEGDQVASLQLLLVRDSVLVEDIISYLGEPDWVRIVKGITLTSNDCFQTWLIFPEISLEVQLFIEEDGFAGINGSQSISAVTFAPPLIGDEWYTPQINSSFVEWQGYIDYCSLYGSKGESQTAP